MRIPRPGFLEQIDRCKEECRRLKEVVPYIFPAWQELQSAERDFEHAKLRLKAARQRWKKD